MYWLPARSALACTNASERAVCPERLLVWSLRRRDRRMQAKLPKRPVDQGTTLSWYSVHHLTWCDAGRESEHLSGPDHAIALH